LDQYTLFKYENRAQAYIYSIVVKIYPHFMNPTTEVSHSPNDFYNLAKLVVISACILDTGK